jgi:uncharacterized membrane protein
LLAVNTDGSLMMGQANREWHGPIPSPEAFEALAKVNPTFPDRIMAMTEQQSAHRRNMEDRALAAQIADAAGVRRRGHFGMACGFILVAGCLVSAAIAESNGHSAFAIALVSAPMASIATVFVVGKLAHKPNHEETKRKAD